MCSIANGPEPYSSSNPVKSLFCQNSVKLSKQFTDNKQQSNKIYILLSGCFIRHKETWSMLQMMPQYMVYNCYYRALGYTHKHVNKPQ